MGVELVSQRDEVVGEIHAVVVLDGSHTRQVGDGGAVVSGENGTEQVHHATCRAVELNGHRW